MHLVVVVELIFGFLKADFGNLTNLDAVLESDVGKSLESLKLTPSWCVPGVMGRLNFRFSVQYTG